LISVDGRLSPKLAKDARFVAVGMAAKWRKVYRPASDKVVRHDNDLNSLAINALIRGTGNTDIMTAALPVIGSRNPFIRIHPFAVRVTHWINALAIVAMIASGWQIYNASPLFDFRFPKSLTLGGWLAGALQWHFAVLWLLTINGLIYLLYSWLSGHFRRDFAPINARIC